MNLLLPKSKLFLVVMLLFVFVGNVNAQCSITSSINSSTLVCGTSPLVSCNGVLNIGDGINSMSLNMNADLNLICLGPIQFIIKNGASLDFSNGNYNLLLAAGSSILLETTYGLSGGNGSNCSASDLISIGGVKIAACNPNQNSSLYSFDELEAIGGYNVVKITPTSVCGAGSYALTATTFPLSSGTTYEWYSAQSGGTPLSSLATYTPTVSTTTTYYIKASNLNFRTPVTVTVNSLPTITGTLSVCVGSTTTLMGSATPDTTTPWSSANTNIATITSGGIVTGVASGTTVITYKNTKGCTTTATVTVKTSVGITSITPTGGIYTICPTATTVLTANGVVGTNAVLTWYTGPNGTGTNLGSSPTITVSPGTYYARVTGDCGSPAEANYTINSIAPVGWANLQFPGSGSICLGGSFTAYGQVYLAGVTPGAGLQGAGITAEFGYSSSNTDPSTWSSANWSVAAFNAGGGGANNDEYSYNFLPPSSGTYYYTFRYRTGTCNWQYGGYVLNAGGFWGGSNVSGILTVNATVAAPTIGTITQPTCTLATGSVILSGLPASGTWTLTRSGTSSATSPGTGTSTTISGLAAGTYNYTVSNGTCTSLVSANVVINASSTKTWAGSWTPSAPTEYDAAIFASGTYNSTGDLAVCSCQVNGAIVTFLPGHTLTVTNAVTVSSGSLSFNNSASLVQINNVDANSGNISYERIPNYARNTDYVYWSSPVLGQTIGLFSPNTLSGKYYSFDDTTSAGWVQEGTGTVMQTGKGYIIRGQEAQSGFPAPPPSSYVFNGKPNNGYKEIVSIIADKSYLIGNPYPSALDADTFLLQNKDVLYGTLYFWTHATEIGKSTSNVGTGALPYTQDDYASYNFTGGVGVGVTIDPANPSASTIPTGKIGAGQGFFASSKPTITGTKIVFNNSARVGVNGILGTNSQFFKLSNTKGKTTNVVEKNRVWLNLTNTEGAFKQTLVGYITGATNDIDDDFDGESFDGQEFVDFYSVNQDKNLTIQGRALPFNESDTVPLGFRSTIEGLFTISIDQVDGSMTNQTVFIEDKLTNTIFDLKSGNYNFNTIAGTFNDRFVLRYTNPNGKTLGTNTVALQVSKVLVSNKNKQIKVNSFSETIDKVSVYDLLGRQVYQKANVNSNELSISNLVSSRQTLLVKTVLQNGETVSTKIIY